MPRRTYPYLANAESQMLDLVFLLVGGGFFVAAILYAYACEQL